MKSQFILIFSLALIVSLNATAGNGNNTPQQPKEDKKTVKPKYDFNIFKFFSIPTLPQTDSLKKDINPRIKPTLFFSKETLITKTKQTYIVI